MNKFISFILSAAFLVPVASADFVDHGVNQQGRQCFDSKCNIVYTNDYSLIGEAGTLSPYATSKVAQPKAPTMEELTARHEEVIRQIKMILSAKK